jgi:two-component sensor histidine kinase/GAF domain-containing protein
VPIKRGPELLGVLNVDNKINPFSSADVELLSLLATQAAAAIRNARLVSSLREGEERYRNLAQHNAQLYAETQQQLKEQTALREAAAVISSTLDVATVLSRIAAQMGQAIDVTSAYICSYEIELRTSTVIAEYFSCYSSPAEQVSDLGVTYYLPDDFSGALAFLQSDQPFCVHHVDNPNVPESDRRHMRQFGAQTVLLIPLEIGGEIIGYASLWESRQCREFTGAEITLCQGIAQQAAIAIENARLLEQARQDAATKAILLEEVNHRVKNNLTTIIGLLYAERRHHPNIENHASLQKVIQDLINRVQGLATVHSLLSAAEWTPLSLSELTRQIIASALQIAPYNAQIQVIVSPSPLRVTPQQANSLALVINELTTNAVKYALSKQRSAQIVVNIDCAEGMILVEYRTSGPGYPPDVLSLERHNTGMYLIQNIVSKGLQGTITLQNASGAVASIRFPALLE